MSVLATIPRTSQVIRGLLFQHCATHAALNARTKNTRGRAVIRQLRKKRLTRRPDCNSDRITPLRPQGLRPRGFRQVSRVNRTVQTSANRVARKQRALNERMRPEPAQSQAARAGRQGGQADSNPTMLTERVGFRVCKSNRWNEERKETSPRVRKGCRHDGNWIRQSNTGGSLGSPG